MAARYLYLNREGRWLDFRRVGLDLPDDGSVCLTRVPAETNPPPTSDPAQPSPSGPGGIAVLPDRTVLWTDGRQPKLFRVDGCSGEQGAVPCVGGEGSAPTQLREPRGLLFDRTRNAVLVADSRNHRIQLFDPVTFQLRDVWPVASPLALALDQAGAVYIVTAGDPPLVKVDATGNMTPFGVTAPPFQRAIGVAVGGPPDAPRVCVLDATAESVRMFDPDGAPQGQIVLGNSTGLLGLAVSVDAVFVGENGRRAIRKYRLADRLLAGDALYDGSVAALAFLGSDTLLVNVGAGAPRRLSLYGGHLREGLMWGGPFTNPSGRREQWHWLRAEVESPSAGDHVQLFVYRTKSRSAAAGPDSGPSPDADSLDQRDAFCPAFDKWLGVAPEADQCLFRGGPDEDVWIGVALAGEGRSSPVVRQLRIDFDHGTLLDHLPAIFQEDDSRLFSARFLTLFESLFHDLHARVTGLPRYADAGGAPPEALPWLAGWLGLSLPESWPEPRRRAAIADAFVATGRRGTASGLRDSLRTMLGIDAVIEEPIRSADWWVLPDDGEDRPGDLGSGTMLTPSEPQGAVLGSTAVLDQSKLIEGAGYGTPLFEDLAHRFVVSVRRRPHDGPDDWKALRAVIDRERPAHTLYELCVVEPRMRVGRQARVGIDTVVAAPPSPAPLGTEPGLLLAGDGPGRIGAASDIGKTTRLGNGAID